MSPGSSIGVPSQVTNLKDPVPLHEIDRAKRAIIRDLHKQHVAFTKIAVSFGCARATVADICKNVTKDNVSEDVRYLNSPPAKAESHSRNQKAKTGAEEDDHDDASGHETSSDSAPNDDSEYEYESSEPDSDSEYEEMTGERRVSARLRREPAPYIRTSLSPDVVLRHPRKHKKQSRARQNEGSDSDASDVAASQPAGASMSRASPRNMNVHGTATKSNGRAPGARTDSATATVKAPMLLPRTVQLKRPQPTSSASRSSHGQALIREPRGRPSRDVQHPSQPSAEVSSVSPCIPHLVRPAPSSTTKSFSSQPPSPDSGGRDTRVSPAKRKNEASGTVKHDTRKLDIDDMQPPESKRSKLLRSDSPAAPLDIATTASPHAPAPDSSTSVPSRPSALKDVHQSASAADRTCEDDVSLANGIKMEEDVRVELPRAQGGSSTQTRTPTATVPPRVPTPSASTAQRSVAPTTSVDGQESRNVALPLGTSSPRPRQSPEIYIDVRSSSPASPIAAAKLTAPKSPVWKVDPVDHAGSQRVSVGSTSSEAQTLSSGIQPASAAHKCPPAPRDTIDPDVRRYLESLGFEPEVYASKLEIIGLKNGAVINAIKNFVPESRKDKLEEDLQNLAGLTVGESMALISGLRRSA